MLITNNEVDANDNSEYGLFIVNALSKALEGAKLYQYLTRKFQMFFIYCNRLVVDGFSYQMVIYCSHRPPIPKPSIKLKSFDVVLSWR
ncbi:unnamed protein product [Cylicocyclus nassatus]|uniref:Uncharacterized protein n=1 Tax=Cylicocyclus nassatus TaxID=53992 RepID=A0AA36H7F0_CYLNA|nr:unnamed protein product [Cylicocyclus nassatus]